MSLLYGDPMLKSTPGTRCLLGGSELSGGYLQGLFGRGRCRANHDLRHPQNTPMTLLESIVPAVSASAIESITGRKEKEPPSPLFQRSAELAEHLCIATLATPTYTEIRRHDKRPAQERQERPTLHTIHQKRQQKWPA